MQWTKITDCGTHAYKASRSNRYVLITNAEDPEWSLDDADDYTVGFYVDGDPKFTETVITLIEAKARGERWLSENQIDAFVTDYREIQPPNLLFEGQ